MEREEQCNNRNASLSQIAEYGGSDSESEAEGRAGAGHESDAPELSEMVVKNNIINACAHGPLPRAAPAAPRPDAAPARIIISGDYRDQRASSTDSDSDADSVREIDDASSGEECAAEGGRCVAAPRVAGELALEELPPIEDLALSLPAHETQPIGAVASIVDQLVIVKGAPGSAAVDLDSVLFLDEGARPLGRVFDVFGPVTEPHYAVRFNSREHVAARGVALGAPVCVAPRSDLTTYVFLPDLIKMKGSDASWKDDVEPPPAQLDYSDDEEERRARRGARGARPAERRPPRPGGRGRAPPPPGRRAPWPRPPYGPPPPGFPPPAFVPPVAGWPPPFAPYCGPPARPRWLHSQPPPPPPPAT